MRPIPIPDDLIPEGGKRFVISAPDGDLTNDQIRPVEAVAAIDDQGVRLSMLVALEPGDLERLALMHRDVGVSGVWLTMWTNQLPPFAVEIADGQG